MNAVVGRASDPAEPIAEAVVAALTGVFPDGVGLHEPEFQGNEWDYVKECIDTGWVSTAGRFVERFEQDIKAVTASPHAIATVNGTAALHGCLMLAGVEAGDEVIVPALGFVATANAVRYCGAEPHLADVDSVTLGLDAARLADHLGTVAERRDGQCFNRQTGRRIRAVIGMHCFGHPIDIEPLIALCDSHDLWFIEDAAESLGSYYKGRHTGTFAPLAALSFNGNKIATTGGGGAILTPDDALATRAKHLTTTAKTPHPFEFIHDDVGYNYRMPNINAALGCAQLEQLDGFLDRKRRLAEGYRDLFDGLEGVTVFPEPPFAQSNYWLNVLLLDPGFEDAREQILIRLHAVGIQARAIWTLFHRLPMFQKSPAMDLSAAEQIYARAIALPSSAALVEAFERAP